MDPERSGLLSRLTIVATAARWSASKACLSPSRSPKPMWEIVAGSTRAKIRQRRGDGQRPRFQIHPPPDGSLYWPTVATPVTSTSTAARIEPSLSGESVSIPGLRPWDCLAKARAEKAGRPVVFWESPSGEAVAGIGGRCLLEASGSGCFAERCPPEAPLRLRAGLFGAAAAGLLVRLRRVSV